MRDIIPQAVLDQIQRHLRSRTTVAQRGFFQTRQSEDSTTGALGERLRTTRSSGRIVDGKEWRWRVSSTKLRGDGPQAAERDIGADGMIQVEVEDRTTGDMWRKGFLFQAKNRRKGSLSKLKSQIQDMETLTPNESLIINYTDAGFEAIRGADFLESGGQWRTLDSQQVRRLGELLADDFVPCKFGVRGLYFDAHRQIILVPSRNQIKMKRFPIRYRISVDVSVGLP